MAQRWDFFVVFGDMRTGSNYLESSINAYPGLQCHGELFNPTFIGHSGTTRLFDMTLEERDADPMVMIGRMRGNTKGLAGFRLFPGHNPNVLDACLRNRACAKIVLSRNPIDSYVSLKIARKTGQWWLGDDKAARTAKAEFVASEFDDHLAQTREFYGHVRRVLQTTGQSAFHVHYDDLHDTAILDGLAAFLKTSGDASRNSKKGRVQNPMPLEEKVSNFADLERAVERIDWFDIFRIPDFEPRRAANIPTWMIAAAAKVVFLPVPCGPTERVATWLRSVNGGEVETGSTQKRLRQWKRQTPGHRSFTVISHPVERAHRAFYRHIVARGSQAFAEIRSALESRYRIEIPEDNGESQYDREQHRKAFLGFLRFLRPNLAGQTSVRVPAAWASQAKILQGFAEFASPDTILRSTTLDEELGHLAVRMNLDSACSETVGTMSPFQLEAIYDEEIENAGRSAYQRDYMLFGFGAWR